MQSEEVIKLYVYKPEDYKPIPPEEKTRIKELIGNEVLKVANRFDGCSKFTIHIHAKGNA